MSEELLAVGSTTDCCGLVDKFALETARFSFTSFAEKWRSYNFDLIFCGRSPEELSQLTVELLTIAKNIISGSGNHYSKRVGGLFLLYSLYFRQETRVKIRITLHELKDIFSFIEELEDNSNVQEEVAFVFQKLFIDDAFLFCTTPNEHLHSSLRRNADEETEISDSINDIKSKLLECDGLSANNISELDAIHSKYEDVKRHFADDNLQSSSPAAPNKTFVKDILSILATLRANIEKSKGTRVKESKELESKGEEENQGTVRRRIVNMSFQSQTNPRHTISNDTPLKNNVVRRMSQK